MLIYLAGPITGATYDAAVQWREDAALAMPSGARAISPMRGKEYLKKTHPNGLPVALAEGTLPMSSAKAIFSRDTFDIRRADAVLLNLTKAERVSVGTMFEMGYAYALGKAIITVIEDGNVHDHPFVWQASTFIVPSVHEALALIRSLV